MSALSAKRTILVVEDDRDVREAIAEVLSDGNYVAVPASNGVEALERLRAAPVMPCVILLDIMMPMMDGWQFRSEQQRDDSMKDIPVIVLSAGADASDVAAKMEAAGYLRKPVALERLLGIVEQFCESEKD
ncbi:MAG TPA: response regulator [Myxococcales bacterium]|nr:response regulator [Myxococcales bacterium]